MEGRKFLETIKTKRLSVWTQQSRTSCVLPIVRCKLLIFARGRSQNEREPHLCWLINWAVSAKSAQRLHFIVVINPVQSWKQKPFQVAFWPLHCEKEWANWKGHGTTEFLSSLWPGLLFSPLNITGPRPLSPLGLKTVQIATLSLLWPPPCSAFNRGAEEAVPEVVKQGCSVVISQWHPARHGGTLL